MTHKMDFRISPIVPDYFPDWHNLKGKRAFILFDGMLLVSRGTYQEVAKGNIGEVEFCLMDIAQFEAFMDRLHGRVDS